MTMACICDRCGRIAGMSDYFHSLVIGTFPWQCGQEEVKEVHLCGECWEDFEEVYLHNLIHDGMGMVE